jgi:hypothetical protein
MPRSTPQRRNSCNECGATWWWTPGSQIDPRDHARPDGQECRTGNPAAPVKSEFKPRVKRISIRPYNYRGRDGFTVNHTFVCYRETAEKIKAVLKQEIDPALPLGWRADRIDELIDLDAERSRKEGLWK